MEDQREVDKRKMNLIVFGLPEIELGQDSVWNTPEKVEKDIESMNQLITEELGVGLDGLVIIWITPQPAKKAVGKGGGWTKTSGSMVLFSIWGNMPGIGAVVFRSTVEITAWSIVSI